jgi:hypothetical protein
MMHIVCAHNEKLFASRTWRKAAEHERGQSRKDALSFGKKYRDHKGATTRLSQLERRMNLAR